MSEDNETTVPVVDPSTTAQTESVILDEEDLEQIYSEVEKTLVPVSEYLFRSSMRSRETGQFFTPPNPVLKDLLMSKVLNAEMMGHDRLTVLVFGRDMEAFFRVLFMTRKASDSASKIIRQEIHMLVKRTPKKSKVTGEPYEAILPGLSVDLFINYGE